MAGVVTPLRSAASACYSKGMTDTEPLPNIAAVNGTLVHKAKLVKLWAPRPIPAPACRSRRQLERQVVTGLDTNRPVTCPRCLKL